MARLSLLTLLTLLACSGDKDDTTTTDEGDTDTDTDADTDTDTDADTDTDTEITDSAEYTEDCGNTPPVLVRAVPSSALYGTDAVVAIDMEVSDADGDLHRAESFVWFDTVIDGVVDTSLDPLFASLDFTDQVAPCGLPSFEITLNIPVLLVSMELETEYEFGFVMVDASGNVSNIIIAPFCTPNAAGEDGDCGGTAVETGDTGTAPTGDTGTPTTGDTGTPTTGDTGALLDSDGDGIPDIVEGTDDFDLDAIPNYLDVDSDGDGHLDAVEGVGDADLDGSPNYLDVDSDGNTIPDVQETEDDLDGDGILNFLDDDTDGDGILDIDELGDADSNGIPDYLDAATPPEYLADVLPILMTNCNYCHLSGGASGGFSMDYAAMLAFSNDVGTMPRIDASGDVTNSYLWHKINGTQGSVGGAGSQMPFGGPFLGAADLDVIQAWIEGGAQP